MKCPICEKNKKKFDSIASMDGAEICSDCWVIWAKTEDFRQFAIAKFKEFVKSEFPKKRGAK